jgi:hypothetical protein
LCYGSPSSLSESTTLRFGHVDEDPAAYEQAVATVLQAHGIAQPGVRITSVKRVDLDNDGSSDIIISASRDRDNTLSRIALEA